MHNAWTRYLLLLLFVAAEGCSRQTPETNTVSHDRITHGPILGRLGADEIGIWARTARPGSFEVRYGTDPGMLSSTFGPVATTLERDNSNWAHFTGLEPQTRYHYEVVVPGATSGTAGSFRTLPDAASVLDPEHNPKGLFNLRFEFACGNDGRPHLGRDPSMGAYRTMLDRHREQIDFAVLNGDWLYEEGRETTVDQWLGKVGARAEDTPDLVRAAPRIVGVWENYRIFLDRGKNLAEWHRYIPSFFTYDDHEILNDIYGTATVGLRDRRAVFRDVGVQAWYDYLGWANPVEHTQGIRFGRTRLEEGRDVLVDEKADFSTLDLAQAGTLMVHWGEPTEGVDDNAFDGQGGDPNAGVYEVVEVLDRNRLKIRPAPRATSEVAYSIGRRSYFKKQIGNAEFYFLDTRGQRDLHDLQQPDKPGISMIGLDQRQWLMDGMKSSDADFFFIFSSVNFTIQHVGGGMVRAKNKEEAWTVFLDEREKLIRFWDSLQRPVFVLTGDLHNSFVVKVTDRVWEFASGPHNSVNHILRDEGDRPANGPFKSGTRNVDLLWSTFYLNDIPRKSLDSPEVRHTVYTIVQVNNVFFNPRQPGEKRWVAYPRPHVVVQFYSGITGELLYAHSVPAGAPSQTR